MIAKTIKEILIFVGGPVSAVGALLGYQIGKLFGSPPESCGWQFVDPTYSPAEIHSWAQGTPVALFAREKVQVYLGDCGIDPMIFAVLFALPGVLMIFVPLSLKFGRKK